MRKVLMFSFLGILIAGLEILLALKTVILDYPVFFLVFVFFLLFIFSGLALKGSKIASKLSAFIVFYSLTLLAFYFFSYQKEILLSPYLLLDYFLFYIWPGLLGIVVYFLLREIFRPRPSRPTKYYRLERELHLKAKRRKEERSKSDGP